MDYYYQYNRCRQFTPPGWGTARTLAPCDRLGRAVAFQAQCRASYPPIMTSVNAGMNMAKDENIKDNTTDPCRGRRFCPPCGTQAPINVQLKMCQLPDGDTSGGGNANNAQGWGNQQQQQGWGGQSQGYGSSQMSNAVAMCAQCPNTCPLPRCPPGVKVERTLPIIPARRMQESYFKMPSASVYKTDYVPRKGEVAKSFAPERNAAQSEGEFQQESVMKYDYKPKPVSPYQKPPWSFAKERQENTTKLDGISQYKIDYTPKCGKPAPSAKPERFFDPDAPSMDDRTVYQIEYIERPLPERSAGPSKEMLAEMGGACCPFDGLTIYKRDYVPKRGLPAESVINKEKRYAKVLDPMDGTTTYKASFGPFYFEDYECIPADLYDAMFPPKDKCCDVRAYPEAMRELENPVQPPQPPCPSPAQQPYCPTPEEMRCSPRNVSCVPQYKLKKEGNPYDGCTTIRVEHNTKGNRRNEGIEYICPEQPCKESY